MDQTDGSFRGRDVCVCGGHAGIGYYAVLGAAGELAARKIQAEGISVRILFRKRQRRVSCGCLWEIQKAASALKQADVFVGRGNGGSANPIVYACAGGTKVQDPGMHALEETADKNGKQTEVC